MSEQEMVLTAYFMHIHNEYEYS